jgi:rod shape-determining protein MreD
VSASMDGRLALPGDGRGRMSLRPNRAMLGLGCGVAWLLARSSLLPLLGLAAVPFDPIIPLIVAYSVTARRSEALGVAVGLGLVADSMAGGGSLRLLLQYLVVVIVASPSEGHIVLRDRWMPTLAVAMLAGSSGLVVYLLLSLFGAELPRDVGALPGEILAAAVASVVLWPALVRLAGIRTTGAVSVGQRL